MSEDLKLKLDGVSQELANLNATNVICAKLVEKGAIKIVDNGEIAEGEDPMALNVNGEIIGPVLAPIARMVAQRKEQLLTLKEKLLEAMEAESAGSVTTEETPAETEAK